jgi:hypothetical protein
LVATITRSIVGSAVGVRIIGIQPGVFCEISTQSPPKR